MVKAVGIAIKDATTISALRRRKHLLGSGMPVSAAWRTSDEKKAKNHHRKVMAARKAGE